MDFPPAVERMAMRWYENAPIGSATFERLAHVDPVGINFNFQEVFRHFLSGTSL